MSAPTENLTWGESAVAATEPSGGKKAAGFVLNEQPPVDDFNWWMRGAARWIAYYGAKDAASGIVGLDANKAAAIAATTGDALTVTTAAGNGKGVVASGNGSGAGVAGTGGATGSGVTGAGGATGGTGVVGTATAVTASGVSGTGGATSGKGVVGSGGGSGAGVAGTGGTTGIGVVGTGGATSGSGGEFTGTAGNAVGAKGAGQGSGSGIEGTGGATGMGVKGTGGATSGSGGEFTGTAGNAAGVKGTGQGSGPGGLFTGGATGDGLQAVGGGSANAITASGGDVGVRSTDRIAGWFTGSGTGCGILADGTGNLGAVKGTTGTAAQAIYGESTAAGNGVFGYASGAGSLANAAALWGQSDGASSALAGDSSRGTGFALQLLPDLTSPVRAAVRWPAQNSTPTGAHQIGDMFVDSVGNVMVCVTAGTPGTWWRVGRIGTTTNDSAAAGEVGEYVESVQSGIGSWSTGVNKNITSISLTAGDWDVSGIAGIVGSAITGTSFEVGIGTTTADIATFADTRASGGVPATSAQNVTLSIAPKRFSLSGTTTVYLVGVIVFSAGTPSVRGRLSARRVR